MEEIRCRWAARAGVRALGESPSPYGDGSMEDDGVGVSEGKALPTRMWRRTWSSRVGEGCGGWLAGQVAASLLLIFDDVKIVFEMAARCRSSRDVVLSLGFFRRSVRACPWSPARLRAARGADRRAHPRIQEPPDDSHQSPKVEMIDSRFKPLDDGIIRELLHNQSAKKANADNFQYFQVEYIEDKLQKYIQEDDDTLPPKPGDGTVSCDTRFMLGTDKRATITMNRSWFRHHTNIQEGDICAFHFKRKEGRRLSLTVHHL